MLEQDYTPRREDRLKLAVVSVANSIHQRRHERASYLWPGTAPAALRSPPPPRWGRGWEEACAGTGRLLEQGEEEGGTMTETMRDGRGWSLCSFL